MYWGAGSSSFFADEEQLSLHTTAAVKEMKTALTSVVSVSIVVGVPLLLSRVGVSHREPSVWFPLVMLVSIHLGNLAGFLSHQACGHCAENELTETLLASSMVFFACVALRSEGGSRRGGTSGHERGPDG